MYATLGLAGFRISEMLDSRFAHVDLARGRFKVIDAKTDAGIREVEMTLYLRDELLAYVMDRRRRGLPCEPGDYFFGTARGKRLDPAASAIASSAARWSGRTWIAPRPDCRPCPRSRRTPGDGRRRPSPPPSGATPSGSPRRSATPPAVHLLGLPAGGHPPLHRRPGDLGDDALRRRAGRADAHAPASPPGGHRPAGATAAGGAPSTARDDGHWLWGEGPADVS